MEGTKTVVKVGSRKSQLALIQTNTIIAKLKEIHSNYEFEVVSMTTTGDKILDSALSKIGAKDLFTRELELALEKGDVDFVVHSLKDLPTRIVDSLVIGCVYKRDSEYDAVVMHPKHKGKKLDDLDENSVIGTSSLRRAAQLARRFPTFKFENIRGNLNTRLKKLDEDNKYDAIILAEAGLVRMGWNDRIAQVLTPSECMYAVSQGAMAVECRAGDEKTLALLSPIHDQDTALQCIAERAFLKQLEGGCSVPVCVCSTLTDSQISLKGGVYSIDGKQSVIDTVTKTFPEEPAAKKKATNGHTFSAIVHGNIELVLCQTAEAAGMELANRLLVTEAADILAEAKRQTAEAVIAEQKRKEQEALNIE
ncbi:HEM3-like protein [Mya arenaria]|uniref:hydroxymethylbilane synthase n=1 Tax=Mya arenaria TaxID=6604 RepID=A0ABY7E2X1_MYAAR|nr:HEM3-like protein [Mya arenaria]